MAMLRSLLEMLFPLHHALPAAQRKHFVKIHPTLYNFMKIFHEVCLSGPGGGKKRSRDDEVIADEQTS
jgi:hypothetical protein